MKRMTAILLTLVMLLSLAACGGSAPAETTAPALVGDETTVPVIVGDGSPVPETEATTEPTTAPTLSPEEILYNSLSDRMKQAVDVGIVELSQLEDLERTVTVAEASAMLQVAYVHRAGVESENLNDLINTPEYAQRDADHYWIWNIPGQLDMELGYPGAYKNRKQWIEFCCDVNKNDLLWWSFSGRLGLGGSVFVEGEDAYRTSNQLAELATTDEDWEIMKELMLTGDGGFYGPSKPANHYVTINNYSVSVYDSTNGRRFNRLVDGNMYPAEPLTVAEAAEMALIYYNYPNPMAYPEFVEPENVGKYNEEIITADLLTKETDLPAASCEHLPAEWHGVVMDDMQLVFVNGHQDNEIYEYEIQAVKEAGFNYIGLELDFSWLEDLILFEKRPGYEDIYNDSEDQGKLSLERLEKLDRVLALCMQYDIHLNLRATSVGQCVSAADQVNWGMKERGLEETFPALWQAIARRYADIPNEYLSFTLFTGMDSIASDEILLPAIDAIREESPDRCIIADIYHKGMNAGTFAEKGVALSYRMGENTCDAFVLDQEEIASDSRGSVKWHSMGVKAVNNFEWPYQGTMDAAALLTSGKGETFQTVMETANSYGVGFMLGEFGVSYQDIRDYSSGIVFPTFRYPDDAYQAMITDITATVEELGCGWCFGSWYGAYGIAFDIPAIKTSTYEQVEDYPYYIDQGMFSLFQTLNGIQ